MKFKFELNAGHGVKANDIQSMKHGINFDSKELEFYDEKHAECWAEDWIQREIYMNYSRHQFTLKILQA